MDFETVLQAYLSWDYEMVMGTFETAGTWPGPPAATDVPARRLRDVITPIAEHAYWSRKTNEVLAKLGLAYVPGYVWGRAAVLGEPPAEVVVAAFAVYEPRLVAAVYEEARRQCGRAGLLAAREEATIESLEEVLGDVDVTATVTALRRGVEAADGFGRPLCTRGCARWRGPSIPSASCGGPATCSASTGATATPPFGSPPPSAPWPSTS